MAGRSCFPIPKIIFLAVIFVTFTCDAKKSLGFLDDTSAFITRLETDLTILQEEIVNESSEPVHLNLGEETDRNEKEKVAPTKPSAWKKVKAVSHVSGASGEVVLKRTVLDTMGKSDILLKRKAAFSTLIASDPGVLPRLKGSFQFETAWAYALLDAAGVTDLSESSTVQIKSFDGTVLYPRPGDAKGRRFFKAFLAFYEAYDAFHPSMHVKEKLTDFLKPHAKETAPKDQDSVMLFKNRFWTALHHSSLDMKTKLDVGLLAGHDGVIDDDGLQKATPAVKAGRNNCIGPPMKPQGIYVNEIGVSTCQYRNNFFRHFYWYFLSRGRISDTTTVKQSRVAGGLDIINGGTGSALLSTLGEVLNPHFLNEWFSDEIPHGKDYWDPAAGGLVFELFARIGSPFAAAVSGTTEMFILAMEQGNLIDGSDLLGRELLLVMWMAQLILAGHHSFTEIFLASRMMGYFESVPAPDLRKFATFLHDKIAETQSLTSYFEKNTELKEPLQFFPDESAFSSGMPETYILFSLYIKEKFGLFPTRTKFLQIQMPIQLKRELFPFLCKLACPDIEAKTTEELNEYLMECLNIEAARAACTEFRHN